MVYKAASQNKSKGFTLVEVLVALLILAIVMLAVGVASSNAIRDTTRIKQHMLAPWVAENVLTQMQIGEISVPTSGDIQQQSISMDGYTWYWSGKVGDPAFASFVPVTVGVSVSASANPIVHHTGYVEAG